MLSILFLEKYLIENNKPIFSNKKNYYKYPEPILKVFNPKTFHENFVIHLFAGDDKDGWKKERYEKLC